MHVVIDIPEKLYKDVVEHTKNGYTGSDVWIAVANGIPLPKGHGRLIDADAIELPSEEMISRLMIGCAETIVEADKRGKK
jgi:hypothetical protein